MAFHADLGWSQNCQPYESGPLAFHQFTCSLGGGSHGDRTGAVRAVTLVRCWPEHVRVVFRRGSRLAEILEMAAPQRRDCRPLSRGWALGTRVSCNFDRGWNSNSSCVLPPAWNRSDPRHSPAEMQRSSGLGLARGISRIRRAQSGDAFGLNDPRRRKSNSFRRRRTGTECGRSATLRA
jgi:hypothetical protein